MLVGQVRRLLSLAALELKLGVCSVIEGSWGTEPARGMIQCAGYQKVRWARNNQR